MAVTGIYNPDGSLVTEGPSGTQTVLVTGSDGSTNRTLKTNTSGSLSQINSVSYIDSSTPLGISGGFAGSGHDAAATTGDMSSFGYFQAFAYTDQSSVAAGFHVQGSDDNSVWNDIIYTTVNSLTGTVLRTPIFYRYHRIIYTNGSTAQTSFRLRSGYFTA